MLGCSGTGRQPTKHAQYLPENFVEALPHVAHLGHERVDFLVEVFVVVSESLLSSFKPAIAVRIASTPFEDTFSWWSVMVRVAMASISSHASSDRASSKSASLRSWRSLASLNGEFRELGAVEIEGLPVKIKRADGSRRNHRPFALRFVVFLSHRQG